jgi:hypothetical protein
MEQNNQHGKSTSSMSSNTKHLIIAAAAIIVVVAIAITVPHLHKAAPVAVTPVTSTVTAAGSTIAPSKTTSQSLSSSGWVAMLNEYSGRVVIFDAACQATPYSQVQGLGAKVLLVNNSTVPHTVIAGAGSGAVIDAYHYKTITLGTSDTIDISCDNNPKAAIITVK